MLHRRILSETAVVLLVLNMAVIGFNVRLAKSWAGETIHIKADGSIYPEDAPISTLDKVIYTVSDDITITFGAGISVERNDTVIDGAGYTLQGDMMSQGILLSNNRNVTIQNFKIKEFGTGILVWPALFINITGNTIGSISNTHNYGINCLDSSHITITGNNITNSNYGIAFSSCDYSEAHANSLGQSYYYGIGIYSSNNIGISGNNITGYGDSTGIDVSWSINNDITENIITDHHYGLEISANSQGNTIAGNTIANNTYGIVLSQSSGNTIYHNNFINSSGYQAWCPFCINTWDNGYPSGGNYWNDYTSVDLFTGPYQNVDGSDGICDNPYEIDSDNKDNYPLADPWSKLKGDLDGDLDVDFVDLHIFAEAYGTRLGEPKYHTRADLDQDGDVDALDLYVLGRNFGKLLSFLFTAS